MTATTDQAIAKQHRNAGFTLAELLIVVAIVAILVAIAIPVFISATKTAKEATCAANRRALKGMVVDSYLLNHGTQENLQTIFDSAYTSLKDQNGGKLCPTDGTYSLKTSFVGEGVSIVIKCGIHGLGVDEEMYEWVLAEYQDSKYSDWLNREQYGTANNVEKWPKVTGADGKTYFLQFKSHNNKANSSFLYAGYEENIVKNSGANWRARYICDSAGELSGKPGQWYELPENTDISAYGDDAVEKLASIIKEKGTPVNFAGEEFKRTT